MIPKSLLIKQGYRRLRTGDRLEVIARDIEFPVFSVQTIKILCADKILSMQDNHSQDDNSTVMTANYINELPTKGSTPTFEFGIVGSEDTAQFKDRKNVMQTIVNPHAYLYRLRITNTYGNVYVKELISASLKCETR